MGAILVTGGAGYIGSHVVKVLGEAGREVVTLDNLSRGFREAVLYGDLVVGGTGDAALVRRVLSDYDVDTVMHFAALTIVPDSVANPLAYYGNNTCATRSLLDCCQEHGVRHFVFSSTAAVYGAPASGLCHETSETVPINPYGWSKLMSEQMLKDLAAISDLRQVTLRYFNVAGSDPEQAIGQSSLDASLLIKVAAEVASGKRDSISIFGTDYPTPDGTGIRDYIHVVDLASAHLAALEYLERGGDSITLNCGYGHGYSVREVLAAVARNQGASLNVVESERRAGDPPRLIADSGLLLRTLDWEPAFDDLDAIVASSLSWERKLEELRAQGMWQPQPA